MIIPNHLLQTTGIGRWVMASVIAALAAIGPACARTTRDSATGAAHAENSGSSRDKDWYSPDERDFRPEYNRDAANQAKQSWDKYWSWIGTYYDGNLLSSGWTKESQDLLKGVKSEPTRDELRASLNHLGRRLAAEWAKDNGVRKIDTSALKDFGERLQKAKERDDGNGQALREAIEAVRADVETKLKGR
jgi:hypothetical protein